MCKKKADKRNVWIGAQKNSTILVTSQRQLACLGLSTHSRLQGLRELWYWLTPRLSASRKGRQCKLLVGELRITPTFRKHPPAKVLRMSVTELRKLLSSHEVLAMQSTLGDMGQCRTSLLS